MNFVGPKLDVGSVHPACPEGRSIDVLPGIRDCGTLHGLVIVKLYTEISFSTTK